MTTLEMAARVLRSLADGSRRLRARSQRTDEMLSRIPLPFIDAARHGFHGVAALGSRLIDPDANARVDRRQAGLSEKGPEPTMRSEATTDDTKRSEMQSEARPSEAPPRADERTIRHLAEMQDGGISSEESLSKFEAGENPGGTHKASTAPPNHAELDQTPARVGMSELRGEFRTREDGTLDLDDGLEGELDRVPPRRKGGMSETRRGQ